MRMMRYRIETSWARTGLELLWNHGRITART